ncbi:hypothetical protein EVU91_07995 [Macrococcoides bohemicum]|uniref:HK97-gp10 family putative phage morphogenesis protein n=1 Tax=Macrococcoides bohemicum TaxID=1903056 RepID=UPI00105A99B7|nr:HK97-gp10 family putative phage morphogenesis protein [Macrococcus bohemicus]TDL37028.1 hypothetical protein EVU91_07995 [Macrococcus bohemicus]
MSVEIKGMDELNKNIMKIAQQVKGASEKALNVGADVQVKVLKETIFVGETGKARDEIVKGKVQTYPSGYKYINIGWPSDSDSGWRIHFPDGGVIDKWGNVRQPPQRKIEKSILLAKKEKDRAIINEFKKHL